MLILLSIVYQKIPEISNNAIKAVSVFLPSVLGRGQARILLELPAEAGGVEVAHGLADLVDGLLRVPEQLLGLVQAQLPQIIREILVHIFFHQMADIGDAEIREMISSMRVSVRLSRRSMDWAVS